MDAVEEVNEADAKPQAAAPIELPAAVRARMNGELDGQSVIAWSEYDLDENNRYARRFAVLTDRQLIVLGDGDGSTETFAISDIEEAKIVEGLGVDRLNVIVGGKLAAEMRYSRRFRRDMTRLHRKLERRLPGKENEGVGAADWLEAAEREAEKREHCPKCGELIPAYAEGVCPQCLAKRKILWRLIDVAKPYRDRVWLSLILTTLVSLMAAVPGVIQRALIDRAIDPKIYGANHEALPVTMTQAERIHGLVGWSVALLATIVISEWLNGWLRRVLALLSCRVTADLRHMIYAHMHELSLRYFSKRRTGSLITRVTNDTDRLWDFIVFGSIDLIRDVVMIVAIASVMFWMNWRLACVSLLPLPVLGVLTYKRGMKMQRLWGKLWTYWSRMSAIVGDALPGVRVVKAFANEDKEIRRFTDRSEEYASREREIHLVWTALQPLVSGLMRFGALLVWIVGGYMLIRHTGERGYTLGVLVAFTGFVWQFYQPIMELANSNRMVTRAATSAQRIFEVLDTPPEIYSRDGAITKDRLDGRVEFRHVAFSYEGAQPALRDVTLSVEPGEMIGLCGPSGAGKSTFVNMICRFYDATDGQILIDGVDIRDYDVRWLRRQIGIVLQEPYLFHGTIAENIRYGNPDADEAQVIRAAKAANAYDFIVGFPDGYDTMVGERGQSLSGGERQRISIARAILHNPRILILDEATSSVDTETEKQIQQALDRLVEGRTTFAIAHRLSTLTAADRLIVLEKGRVVEQGRHADLVNREGGVYAKLHQTQMEMASLVAIS
jgi:ATP-binding cassette subfamily B protein